MATDLIMPTLPGDQQSRHFFPERPRHLRSHSYQVPQGPQISPLGTPDHNALSTPASPKNYHARHLRPMYIPAVLRPNEFPTKRTFKCKPSDTNSNNSDTDSDCTLRRSNISLISLPSLTVFGHRLSRRSTGDSGKSFEGEWDLDLFPEVTALPTRKHWKVSYPAEPQRMAVIYLFPG